MLLKKMKKFFSQVVQEAQKVIWPDKKEVLVSTTIVVVSVFLCSLIVLFFDYGIHGIVSFLLNVNK